MKNIKAAVLLAHGLNDYNVMPDHSIRIYDEMKAARASEFACTSTRADMAAVRRTTCSTAGSRHYLYGIDNGVDSDPPVWIVTTCRPGAADSQPAASLRRGRGASAQGRGRGRGGVPATPFASFPRARWSVSFPHPAAGGNESRALHGRRRRARRSW